ncbi:MAG: hypothetical protein IKC46_10575, partial [Lachnospiraceae bacterium]|nr:hypothetical protein [Lachnospiraceae bacterium]
TLKKKTREIDVISLVFTLNIKFPIKPSSLPINPAHQSRPSSLAIKLKHQKGCPSKTLITLF